MISYKPFFQTLRERNISSYRLVTYYNVNRSLLDRLKHDRPINTTTIDDLCKLLHCRVEDILVFIDDAENETPTEEN
ncbi:MAG: helix-turn-helix transcriptional regulator [Lachnospiraceae bacterium]|nr:helix-turn-helix transcriptional regulator [Lachnospiraceae bacterium]MBR6018614.1 helix-turn-helix transcriptional regulator [Lachnospiraceae bacterium]